MEAAPNKHIYRRLGAIRALQRVSRDATRTRVRFYRSLCTVKVLLAALCSTLTVLAPREEVRIGSR
jgi:hypothetical protein